MYPFAADYNEQDDLTLVSQACGGSREAAGQLVRRHQRFIYNIALKLVREPNDAADLTQEVLVKMVTKLSQYEAKSNFRTWLYRIVMNHFLSAQRRQSETISFEDLGAFNDTIHNDEEMTADEQDTYKDHIITVRNKCMASTLLCLSREQRIVLILGGVFNLRSPIAARLLDMTPENFRKQLSRAKHDLFQFMDDKCGLIDPANPCRCHKKTKGFIKEGKVDAETVRFTREARETIGSVVAEKNEALDQLMEGKYLRLFTGQPYAEIPEEEDSLIRFLLMDKDIQNLFGLN
ncbi:MAG TPA: RNA polymerase sigma factor [Puia sp.]|uniref:RNA polymerase sigma factor n=1 Tax=Puia sp. TaxID=2045100 RepID=UPI002D0AA524|nr:RNA polymerase sigma factor [Puia sp.]HVU98026.1 RNA polymerase sigma factor [Puia sp.]